MNHKHNKQNVRPGNLALVSAAAASSPAAATAPVAVAPVAAAPVAAAPVAAAPAFSAPVSSASSGAGGAELAAAKQHAELQTWAANKLASEGSPLAEPAKLRMQQAVAKYEALKQNNTTN